MSRLITLNVDVKKLDKSKFYEGKKGTYASLDVWVNDEPDQYGNDASVNQSLSKEDRENGVKKTYVGNGKKMFGWGESSSSTKQSDVEIASEPF
jgi:hypothetical protein|tara:strand:- start:456 stop:737 length:282 start_codon:yes stop_codon:yes gene_type:complete